MRLTSLTALACASFFLCLTGAAAAPDGPDDSYTYLAADGGGLTAGSGGGSATTLTVGAGYRFGRHYAIEGGYAGFFGNSASVNGGYVDGYGFLPLGRYSRISLFSTLGASCVAAEASGRPCGVRAGAGVEWRFSDDLGLRAAARYQTSIKPAALVSIGLTWGL